ncbi:MAG: FHA domain-containing protein [Lachnospiraceae bacterium]|nr:FHA domain-containing protein [Lachnospiraceae bacterium]
MRTFNFKARQIGSEKYLTYTMGEECELDEDVLDFCEENKPKELLDIIYEEDDDYDYLTYDITDKVSLEEYISGEMNSEKVLFILRNIASSLISVKEQTIPLGYVLLNRNFMYIKEDGYEVTFLCLPIESKSAVAVEFKSFVRQLLANMKYDVEENLSYVGKLLTYINGDNFNLRGLIGLSEALMEEEGLSFEEAGAIDADGIEVVSSDDAEEVVEAEEKVSDFMSSLSESDEVLPEIGDDEEDDEEDVAIEDEELDSILPAGMKVNVEEEAAEELVEESVEETTDEVIEESVEKPAEEVVEETVDEPVPEVKEESAPIPTLVTPVPTAPAEKKEADIDEIKNKIKQLVGEVPSAKVAPTPGKSLNTISDLDDFLGSKPPVIKKNVVKVNRAAIIQSAAEHEADSTEKLTSDVVPVIEDIQDGMNAEKLKSKSILSKSAPEAPRTTNLASVPKAVPYLIRVNTEERIMLSKLAFKIGKASRGVDYTVDGNGAISRQHAIILQKDGVCYIKDNKSTNHTYVNGHIVEDGVEEILTHDSMIKLGDEEFLFKIR